MLRRAKKVNIEEKKRIQQEIDEVWRIVDRWCHLR